KLTGVTRSTLCKKRNVQNAAGIIARPAIGSTPLQPGSVWQFKEFRSTAGTIHRMANYNTSEFRGGLKILMDGDPCVIVENEFVKPGKGQAFNRVRIRNLRTGRTVDKTFKSGDSVESADVI